jgi:hypothetical protein
MQRYVTILHGVHIILSTLCMLRNDLSIFKERKPRAQRTLLDSFKAGSVNVIIIIILRLFIVILTMNLRRDQGAFLRK